MKSPNIFFAIIIACSLLSVTSCQKDVVKTPDLQNEAITTAEDTSSLLSIRGQKAVTANVDANIGGYLEALPFDYAISGSKKYPLLVFIHGIGELGNGTSDLWKVEKNSVPKLLYGGLFPKTFTVGGKTYSFLVISPQFKYYPQSYHVNDMISYAIKKYRVDESRIYLTGLSLGGGTVMNYAVAYGKRVAAIAPMCESSSPSSDKGAIIAKTGVAVWAFHNERDPRVSSWYTKNYVTYINNGKPAIAARKTIFDEGSHNCWSKASDPNYKEDSMNIYQWMLTNHR